MIIFAIKKIKTAKNIFNKKVFFACIPAADIAIFTLQLL